MIEELVVRSSWGVMLAGPHWLLLALVLASAGVFAWRASWEGVRARVVEERGQVEPLSLLIYVIVAVILIVILLKVLDHV